MPEFWENKSRKGEGTKQYMKRKPKRRSSVPPYNIFWFADNVDWLLIIVGTVGAIANGLVMPLHCLVFGDIMQSLSTNIGIMKYVRFQVYLGIGACAASWAEISCWMHAGERQTTKMRYIYLKAILKQDIAVFDTEMRTGAVLDSLSTDFLLIQDALGEKMGSLICHVSTVFGAFTICLSYVWAVALIVPAILPVVILCGAVYIFALSKLTSRSQKAMGVAASMAEEVLSQIRTVYSYVGESKAIASYSKKLETTVKLGYAEGLAKGLGVGIIKGMVCAAWALVCWYAGVLIRKKGTDPGAAVISIANVLMGVISIGQIAACVNSITKGRTAYSKVVEVINAQPVVKRIATYRRRLRKLQGAIEFRNIYFWYPSRADVTVLENLSLRIPAGDTLALVGGSGSGKSTIISLLERFYEVNKGKILVDKHDIRTLDTKWLRQQIGLVSQEPVLFSTSIRENILYGKKDANEEEVIAAAKAANAHDFVRKLPRGYDTEVGERGVQLSGGQKQRVAIARAIVKNPKILLLDEATSALDSASEQLVQIALNDLMVDRTTVVVAHRLSTIKNVDTIAVMRDGRIMEMGNHEELMAKGDGGAYFSLVNLQQAGYSNNQMDQTKTSMTNFSGHQKSNRDGQVHERYVNMKKTISDAGSEDMQCKACIQTLLKMSAPDWASAILGTLGSILMGCFTPIFSFYMAKAIANFYLPDSSEMKRQLLIKTIIFLGLSFIPLVGNLLQHYFLGIIGENLSRRVREKMLAAILRNEVGWFDKDENSSLRISSRLSLDATNVKSVIAEMMLILQNFTNLVAAVVICFRTQLRMSIVLVATFPILAAANVAQGLSTKGFGGDQAKAHREATVVASEAVANMRTVIAFNGEDKVLSLFQYLLSKPVKRSFRRGQIAGFIYGLTLLGMLWSYGLALWNASQILKKNLYEFQNVIIVYLVLVVSSISVSDTMILVPDVAKGRESVKSVFKILNRRTQMEPDDPTAFRVRDLKGDIEFRQVKFCYPSRPQFTVFKNLNLKVDAGDSLVLVGASGCGKSSIIAMIERFYDPVSGKVMIDGLDIKTLHLRSLRMHIALVQQEPALFAASIRDNILYGNEGAMEEEVIKAAIIANAHGFISKLPEGYGTVAGERGVEMSGGQKQRLAIARAVLKNPRILLLDEATSGLDAESESVVQEALDRVMKGRTSIVVAHRLSTIKNVSSIAVVKNGKIAEQGSHAQLLSRTEGEYYRLLNMKAGPNKTSSNRMKL